MTWHRDFRDFSVFLVFLLVAKKILHLHIYQMICAVKTFNKGVVSGFVFLRSTFGIEFQFRVFEKCIKEGRKGPELTFLMMLNYVTWDTLCTRKGGGAFLKEKRD